MVFEIKTIGRIIKLGLFYPRCDDNINTVEIELNDVRSANDIRVSYDFARDGWIIDRSDYDNEKDGHVQWEEKAFVPAWDDNNG